DQIVLSIALAPHRHVSKSAQSPAHTESIKPDFVNGLLSAFWYRATTGTVASPGNGTTCEITTPLPSLPSSLASELLPTKEMLTKTASSPTRCAKRINSAQAA